MEAIVLKWLSANLGVLLGGIFIIIIATVVVMIRVNTALNMVRDFKNDLIELNAKRLEMADEIKREIELLDKRTAKIVSIMGTCPAPTVANKLWLQNDKRNGGNPPDNFSMCDNKSFEDCD